MYQRLFWNPSFTQRATTTAWLCPAGYCLDVNTSAFPVGTTGGLPDHAARAVRACLPLRLCKHCNMSLLLCVCVCVCVKLHSTRDSRREQAHSVSSDLLGSWGMRIEATYGLVLRSLVGLSQSDWQTGDWLIISFCWNRPDWVRWS